MELSVNDKVTAHPSADGISQAIDAAPHPGDWFLALESQDGCAIDVAVRSDGGHEVVATDAGHESRVARRLTATRVTTILLKYLARRAPCRCGVAARYSQGSIVDVHHDPANPSNAALVNPTGFHWVLLAVAVGGFAAAASARGAFSLKRAMRGSP